MIIDAPHSVARGFLAMKELEAFIPRYTAVVMRTVMEMQNCAERLKADDKEARDVVLGQLLVNVNTYVLGDDPDQVEQWPLTNITPLHTGLAYRSQLMALLAKTEITVQDILGFINLVYFPALNLTVLNDELLANGDRAAPNSGRFQRMLLLMLHQAAMLGSRGELTLKTTDDTEEVA